MSATNSIPEENISATTNVVEVPQKIVIEKQETIQKKPKRQITEKQKKALEKARAMRALNRKKEKTIPKKKIHEEVYEEEPQEKKTSSFGYLLTTGMAGLTGLAIYYFLKQGKNYVNYQTREPLKKRHTPSKIQKIPSTEKLEEPPQLSLEELKMKEIMENSIKF